MSDKDKFRPNDSMTIMRPSVGAAPAPSASSGERTVFQPHIRNPAAPPPPQAAPAMRSEDVVRHIQTLNGLVQSASPLLGLMVQLRSTHDHKDPTGLKRSLAEELRAFERRAQQAQYPSELTIAARYCLCAALDEAVLKTPWGGNSDWAAQSLLSLFHNETWGGEKFFLVLDRLQQNPGRNLDLLELMYLCLRLGFQGKYQVVEGGHDKLDMIQDGLYRSIQAQRGEFERSLSRHWKGVQPMRRGLAQYVPLWVVGAVLGALLVATFLGFSLVLSGASQAVVDRLNNISPGVQIEARG